MGDLKLPGGMDWPALKYHENKSNNGFFERFLAYYARQASQQTNLLDTVLLAEQKDSKS